jgi:hypothetical protein
VNSLDADLALPHLLEPALLLALGRRAALPPLATGLLPLEARALLLEGISCEELGGLLLAEQGARGPEDGVGCCRRHDLEGKEEYLLEEQWPQIPKVSRRYERKTECRESFRKRKQ